MMKLSLPVMQCDPDCGECCGPVLCHPHEAKAVHDYAKARGVEPVAQGLTCPYYQGGACRVYDVRPFVCRLFGHVPKMRCGKGHNVNILPSLERRLLKQYGTPTVLLHEVLPGWEAELMEATKRRS